MRDLDAIDVERLTGVGPKRKAALNQVGIRSVADLLTYYPRRYIDRSRETRLADIEPGSEALVLAKIARIETRRTRNGRSLVTATVTDVNGSGRLSLTFFNQPWRTRQLPVGTEVALFGKVELYRGAKQKIGRASCRERV